MTPTIFVLDEKLWIGHYIFWPDEHISFGNTGYRIIYCGARSIRSGEPVNVFVGNGQTMHALVGHIQFVFDLPTALFNRTLS